MHLKVNAKVYSFKNKVKIRGPIYLHACRHDKGIYLCGPLIYVTILWYAKMMCQKLTVEPEAIQPLCKLYRGRILSPNLQRRVNTYTYGY